MNIKKFVQNIEEYTCAVLLSAMSVIVFWQVICRFLLHLPLRWSEELSIFILVWVTFLGASIGVKRGAHVGIEAFVILLPKKVQHFMKIVAYILSASFFVLLIFLGFSIVKSQMMTGQVSPAMRIPMYYAYLAVPIGSIFISIRFIQVLIDEIKTKGV